MNPELAAIVADMGGIVDAFDLSRKRLGEKALDIIADGILDNAANGLDPDGNRWPELSPEYAAAKAISHPGEPIGVRDGLMLDREQVKGSRRIVQGEAASTYGLDEKARDEMVHFSEGSDNQLPRLVVGITDVADQRLRGLFDDAFRAAIAGP